MLYFIPDVAITGGGFVIETVAAAAGITVPAPCAIILVGGYNEVGDGGDALYKRVAVEPVAHAGKFQDASGAWFELFGDAVRSETFGAIGDNVADDYQPWQDAINYAELVGGTVRGWGLRAYNIETYPIIKTGVTIDFQGCTWNCNLPGDDPGGLNYGPRGMSNCTIMNGTINVISNDDPGASTIWHSALSFGNPYGEQGTILAPNAFDEISGVTVDNMTLSTTKEGGCALACIGLVHDCTFNNINVPDSSTLFIAFGYDWGLLGDGITSDPTTMDDSRLAFDNEECRTEHGYNITVTNWTIGNLTRTGTLDPEIDPNSIGIRFSGAYQINVDNIKIGQVTGYASQFTAGDLGMEFAHPSIKPFACKGWNVNNITCEDCSSTVAQLQYTDTYADNIARAMLAPPDGCNYVPIMSPLQIGSGIMNNIKGVATNAAPFVGFNCQYVAGLSFTNCLADGFLYGFYIQESAMELNIEHNLLRNCQGPGIYVSDGTVPPTDIVLTNNICNGNGTDAALDDKLQSGIYIDDAAHITVRGNELGAMGSATETQIYGLYIDDNCSMAVVENNRVYSTTAAGIAYQVGSVSTIYDRLVEHFTGNTSESAFVGSHYAGQAFLPIEYFTKPDGDIVSTYLAMDASMVASETPPGGFGTLCSIGDIIRIPDSVANWGSICTDPTTNAWDSLTK